MNSTPERVIATLKSMPEYVARFERSFRGEDDPVTFDNVAMAIEAFEATLITPASLFDQFLEGNVNALTAHEKEGLQDVSDRDLADRGRKRFCCRARERKAAGYPDRLRDT